MKTLAYVWLSIAVLFTLASVMWLAVNAPGVLVYLAALLIAVVTVVFTLWAFITLLNNR